MKTDLDQIQTIVKVNNNNKIDGASSEDDINEILIKNLAEYKKIKNLTKSKDSKPRFLRSDTRLAYIKSKQIFIKVLIP